MLNSIGSRTICGATANQRRRCLFLLGFLTKTLRSETRAVSYGRHARRTRPRSRAASPETRSSPIISLARAECTALNKAARLVPTSLYPIHAYTLHCVMNRRRQKRAKNRLNLCTATDPGAEEIVETADVASASYNTSLVGGIEMYTNERSRNIPNASLDLSFGR